MFLDFTVVLLDCLPVSGGHCALSEERVDLVAGKGKKPGRGTGRASRIQKMTEAGYTSRKAEEQNLMAESGRCEKGKRRRDFRKREL